MQGRYRGVPCTSLNTSENNYVKSEEGGTIDFYYTLVTLTMGYNIIVDILQGYKLPYVRKDFADLVFVGIKCSQYMLNPA